MWQRRQSKYFSLYLFDIQKNIYTFYKVAFYRVINFYVQKSEMYFISNVYRMLLGIPPYTGFINFNCVDPLGRSALLMAIDNENLEMVELLITHSVDTKDALLHAISEEFVEAVEVLLDHEDLNRSGSGVHVSFF